MALQTPVCDLFGIELPVFSAGMGIGAGAALRAAVSNAGGCGVIGGNGRTNNGLRTQVLGLRPAGLGRPAALAVLGLNLSAGLPVAGGVVAVAAVVVALIAVRPLVPRGTLTARRGLPSVILTRGLASAAFFGAEVYLPYLLVERYAFSPTFAGLTLTGGAVAWAGGLRRSRAGSARGWTTAARSGSERPWSSAPSSWRW